MMTIERRRNIHFITGLLTVLFLVLLGGVDRAQAQWTTADASGNITNTNPNNVGIGTPFPTNKLTVDAGATSTTSTTIFKGGSGTLEIWNQSMQNLGLRAVGLGVNLPGTSSGSSAGNFLFSTSNGSFWSERMRIVNSTGNVGIGTTSPGQRLHVAVGSGTYSPFRIDGNGAATGMFFTNTATTDGFLGNAEFTGSWIAKDTTASLIGYSSAAGQAFSVYGNTGLTAGNAFTPTELFRVTTGGNVGIGTTGPPATKLDVAGQIRSSTGGFKFPDGTVQTTAAVSGGGTITGVTAGAGLAGGGTSGSTTLDIGAGTGVSVAADSISVNYGSTAGTAVQGNTAITVSPGTGMSGGGSITLGAGGTVTLNNTDRGSSQFMFKNIVDRDGVLQFSALNNSDNLSFEGTGATTVTFTGRKVTINSPTAAASGWTDGGSTISLTNPTANVGIGTGAATPALKTEIRGAAGLPASAGTTQTGITRFSQTSGVGVIDFGFGGSAGNGWIQATSSTNLGTNFGLLLNPNGGNVGIGTPSPTQKLEVAGNLKLSGTGSGVMFPDGTVQTTASTSAAPSGWTFGGSTVSLTSPTANVGIGRIPNDDQPPTPYKLDIAGDVRVSGNLAAKYQDVAEWVPSTHALAAGTVVILNPTKKNEVMASTSAYDTSVAGVVSERPGLTLGEAGADKSLVATTGRVMVVVDASKAPIHIGDLLVTSDEEGVAMKSEPVDLGGVKLHRPGTLIGKALEPLESGKGKILVLLSLQ